jgi:hypothetical protein
MTPTGKATGPDYHFETWEARDRLTSAQYQPWAKIFGERWGQDETYPCPYSSSECAMWHIVAHMLLAALIEVAFLIARASDSVLAPQTGRSAMNELLERATGSAARWLAGARTCSATLGTMVAREQV